MSDAARRLVADILARGVLPSVDILSSPSLQIPEQLPPELTVVTPDVLTLLENQSPVDWIQLDRFRVHYERGRHAGYSTYLTYFLSSSRPSSPLSPVISTISTSVSVSFSYTQPPHKRSVDDFVRYFTHRYHILERLLRGRLELEGVVSISKVLKKTAKENVCIIGIVADRAETKNGNILLTLEDPTGCVNVIINKNKPDLFRDAVDIVLDEVIGVTGVCGERIIFGNNVFWPDIPPNKELKKAPDDVYALFLSDVHVGSRFFLSKEFSRFIRWINGKSGNAEQQAIASRVGYIFFVGDLVDGVGIYPNQDKELIIKDIYEQYSEFARLISLIPHHIKIIVCPGNHDALRLSEPQPPLDPDFAAAVYRLPNVTVVSNPAVVTIHAHDDFPGIDVLMYHGYSFDHYISNVDSLRSKGKGEGGYHRADLVMKFLLKRRHLAPSHTSTLYIPDTETDPLVISQVPDIFVTGHIHYSMIAQYKNVTMISGSCWQGLTTFQEKLGHEPEPARVPIINLKTRQPKIMKFI